jgi:hypothetical protein
VHYIDGKETRSDVRLCLDHTVGICKVVRCGVVGAIESVGKFMAQTNAYSKVRAQAYCVLRKPCTTPEASGVEGPLQLYRNSGRRAL